MTMAISPADVANTYTYSSGIPGETTWIYSYESKGKTESDAVKSCDLLSGRLIYNYQQALRTGYHECFRRC
jgi:hypothetical protein